MFVRVFMVCSCLGFVLFRRSSPDDPRQSNHDASSRSASGRGENVVAGLAAPWPPPGSGQLVPRREPPPFETTQNVLATTSGSEAPRIVSPRAALVYTLRATDRNRQTIPLRADTAAGVRTVYWFAGKQFIGSSAAVDPLMWKPSPGSWKIQALDDHGRTASCMLRVEMVE